MNKAVVDLLAITVQERKFDERIGGVILQTAVEAQPDAAVLDRGAPGRTSQ